jgi:hypothetical protein
MVREEENLKKQRIDFKEGPFVQRKNFKDFGIRHNETGSWWPSEFGLVRDKFPIERKAD